MEIKVRTKEQQAIDNIKAIVNSKDKIIEIEPPIEDTAQILLDCITNLQEKVNQYENPDDMTLFYMWLDEKAKDKMKKLQEENEYLKKLNDEKARIGVADHKYASKKEDEVIVLQKENERLKTDIRYWEDKWQYTKFSDKDYKSRNEKAIEYCKKSNLTLKSHYFSDLLNILGGDDNE